MGVVGPSPGGRREGGGEGHGGERGVFGAEEPDWAGGWVGGLGVVHGLRRGRDAVLVGRRRRRSILVLLSRPGGRAI